MNGLFKQAFSKEEQSVPKEVVRELNKELPRGYKYEWNEEFHQLIIQPTKKKMPNLKYVIEFDAKENELPTKYSDEELMEYIYRTQKTIKAKNVYAIDKKGNKRNIYEDPLTHKTAADRNVVYIIPSPFPPAMSMTFTVEEGEDVIVKIKRIPYNSMDQILLENECPSGIKIRWILDEKKEGIKGQGRELPSATMTITATPSKADSVDDALKGLKILLAFATGTLIIDGHKAEDKPAEGKLDIKDIKEKIFFWETIEKLEKILNVKFDPKADYPVEDARFAYELNQSLIEGSEQVLTAPFEHFHIGGMKFKDHQRDSFLREHPDLLEDAETRDRVPDNELLRRSYEKRLVGKSKATFTFVQDMNCTLLGTKFQLSRATILSNITLEKVVPDGKGMELYIRNGRDSDNPWKMITKYTLTEDEAVKEIDILFNKYCGEKKADSRINSCECGFPDN